MEGRTLEHKYGNRAFIESFVRNKVEQWITELDCLATFAKTQPQLAHFAFTHGLTSEWSYIARTTPDLSSLFQPMENVIRMKLIPGLADRHPPNDEEGKLFALPVRHEGIAMSNPTADTDPASLLQPLLVVR